MNVFQFICCADQSPCYRYQRDRDAGRVGDGRTQMVTADASCPHTVVYQRHLALVQDDPMHILHRGRSATDRCAGNERGNKCVAMMIRCCPATRQRIGPLCAFLERGSRSRSLPIARSLSSSLSFLGFRRFVGVVLFLGSLVF